MMKMRFGQPDVSRPTEITVANALRERAFDAGAGGIGFLKTPALFAVAVPLGGPRSILAAGPSASGVRWASGYSVRAADRLGNRPGQTEY